jgi:maltooligosyltrehalose trehalohydrolase
VRRSGGRASRGRRTPFEVNRFRRYPSFGAIAYDGGVRFTLWAPEAADVSLALEGDREILMQAVAGGYFQTDVPGAAAGMRYRYRVGGDAFPDPASRFQPDGVHGSSLIVDPRAYRWRDLEWAGRPLETLVFYEIHIGTYTPEGTFGGVRRQLGYLRDLGITAVELMPVGDFPGRWNWGYDPAAMFAPSRAYGTPDDLRQLVDDAHRLGLAVLLDVIYNHFGPDGAYAVALSPRFLSARHRTPWGPAINLDGDGSDGVRAFFIENALHWLCEYHLDGLRLDATHALVDDGPRHFLEELAAAVRGLDGWPRLLIAEDHRNLDRLVRPPAQGGYGLDAVWSDDYHHQVRRVLTGQDDGYFEDFTPSTRGLATIIREGWLFSGQRSRYFGGPRGTDPAGIPAWRFIHFIQNHDQTGNRPAGDRLSDAVAPAVYRAISALLLCAPQTPLLFMGQEWAARSPFLYFTEHAGAIGEQVTLGRREEFKSFRGFGEVPDPQDPRTFERSRLRRQEAETEPQAGTLRLYRDLLKWRGRLAAVSANGTGAGRGASRSQRPEPDTGEPDFEVSSPEEGGIVLRRGRYLILVALRGGLTLPCPQHAAIVWQSEDPAYTRRPDPPVRAGATLRFPVPGAVVAEQTR